MKKSSFFLIIFGIFQITSLYPTGAGIGAYRHNQQNGELYFLLVSDPHHSGMQKGFEFPAGTIGDHTIDQLDNNNTLSFVRGAIREAMEELVFAPATHLKLGIAGEPYDWESKSINASYQAQVIDLVQHMMMAQGLIYLHKNQVNRDKPAYGLNQFALFLWDISNIYKEGLLGHIVNVRKKLHKNEFRDHHVGAEPNQFAWVSKTELLKVIDNYSKNSQKPDRHVIASTMYDARGKQHFNKRIELSQAFCGMICDRDQALFNRQLNVFNKGNGQPSSMRAVLAGL